VEFKNMKPIFKDAIAWEKAELLMQPILLRVVDNLRKQLETSKWKGTYQEIQEPIPGHQLSLTCQEKIIKIDVWNLCFRVCFENYHPSYFTFAEGENQTQEVDIEPRLIDQNGELDWIFLEEKTQKLIQNIFNNLP
jgi:hypothetical protein